MFKSLHFSTIHLPNGAQMVDQVEKLWQRRPGLGAPWPRRQGKAFDEAIRRAYRRFRRLYPRWANSLFDDFFLTSTAGPILHGVYRRGRWPTAYELALAWYAQFERNMTEQSLDRVCWALPIAAAFLELLHEEWPGDVSPRVRLTRQALY